MTSSWYKNAAIHETYSRASPRHKNMSEFINSYKNLMLLIVFSITYQHMLDDLIKIRTRPHWVVCVHEISLTSVPHSVRHSTVKCGMKLSIHSQTSAVPPLKFGISRRDMKTSAPLYLQLLWYSSCDIEISIGALSDAFPSVEAPLLDIRKRNEMHVNGITAIFLTWYQSSIFLTNATWPKEWYSTEKALHIIHFIEVHWVVIIWASTG